MRWDEMFLKKKKNQIKLILIFCDKFLEFKKSLSIKVLSIKLAKDTNLKLFTLTAI